MIFISWNERDQDLRGKNSRMCKDGGEDNKSGEQRGIRLAVITQHEYLI
jgi:hypothetical protein